MQCTIYQNPKRGHTFSVMVFNILLTGNTTEQIGGDGSPFHTFPEAKWEAVSIVVTFLAKLGLIIFGILHFISDPCLSNRKEWLFGWRTFFLIVAIFYSLPIFLALGDLDDDTSSGSMLALIISELFINKFLFSMNGRRLYPRLGRRMLFVSMCILTSAGKAQDQYNSIDYYGPVRVTDVELYASRPSQQILTYAPSYYYFYQLKQTLEWGDPWGCPSPSNNLAWCSAIDDFDTDTDMDKCRVRINCDGRPQDYGGTVGECASEAKKKEALSELRFCFASAAQNDALQMADFFTANFTKRVAPWDDTSNPHTVTRSVSCAACTARATPPPHKLEEDAILKWILGVSLVLASVALLLRGIANGQEKEAVFLRAQARIVIPPAASNQPRAPSDLEMASVVGSPN
mmetsp:Transcript_21165/g.36392  ORF Transcript_21165/g.36392 Transcript_21165/m.36392 type:complete len:402 (-) Transcript_21165:381-1586(-)